MVECIFMKEKLSNILKRIQSGEKVNLYHEDIEFLEYFEKDSNGIIKATSLDDPNRTFILNGNEPVSMNMFVFTKDILKHLNDRFNEFLNANSNNILSCEYLIPTVVSELFNENKVTLKLLDTTSVWYGVTYKQDKDEVVKALKELVDNNQYKVGLWK